jgi:hypothetical protein
MPSDQSLGKDMRLRIQWPKVAKLVGFRLLAVVIVVVLIEIFSAGALFCLNGEWISLKDISARQKQVLGENPLDDQLPVENQANLPNFVGEHVIHPYVGFVQSRHVAPDMRIFRPDRQAAEYGFPYNTHSIFQKKSKQKIIIGVFGGSVAKLFAYLGMNALCEQLQELPELSNREPVALNLALGGYKQPQQLMILTYLLALGAQFDMVINLDGFNEVTLPVIENLPKGVSPWFPRGWFYRVQGLNSELRLQIGEIAYLQERRRTAAESFSKPPLNLSMTAGLLWSLIDQNLANRFTSESLSQLSDKPEKTSYQAGGPTQTFKSDQELYAELIEIWKDSSFQMHRLCRANGIRYYHFLQPNQYVPDSKPMGTMERGKAYGQGIAYERCVRKGYPLLRHAGRGLAKRGVRFYDMTMTFSNVSDLLYTDMCCHFNTKGNRILAEAMADSIIQDFSNNR